jgi:mitogen-activated protein kinase organizer 1
MKDFTDSVTSVITTPSQVITGCVDGKLRTYDIRSSILNIDDVKDSITCVRLTYDRKCAVCTCIGENIMVAAKTIKYCMNDLQCNDCSINAR